MKRRRLWKRWQVLVNGTNFRLNMVDAFHACVTRESKSKRARFYQVSFGEEDKWSQSGPSKARRVGFYTMVFVTARSANEAELKAVNVLRQEKRLRAEIANTPNDPPRLFVETIQEISSFRGCHRPRSGLALYLERGQKRLN